MDAKTQKVAHARLERIRARNKGVLTPADVVKDASDESSPLHSYFTWDDTEAAHQYRLDQARTLIRNVKVEVTTSTARVAAPYYIRDPRVLPSQQGYGSLAELRDESTVAADALRYEFDRVVGALERAVSIAEALGMESKVDEFLQEAKSLRNAIPVATKTQPVKVKAKPVLTSAARVVAAR